MDYETALLTIVWCLTAVGVLTVLWWLTRCEDAKEHAPTRPRVYGECQIAGCHVPADEWLLTWTHYDGEALEHREYWLCRHHREQAQAKIDDVIEDWVCV